MQNQVLIPTQVNVMPLFPHSDKWKTPGGMHNLLRRTWMRLPKHGSQPVRHTLKCYLVRMHPPHHRATVIPPPLPILSPATTSHQLHLRPTPRPSTQTHTHKFRAMRLTLPYPPPNNGSTTCRAPALKSKLSLPVRQ